MDNRNWPEGVGRLLSSLSQAEESLLEAGGSDTGEDLAERIAGEDSGFGAFGAVNIIPYDKPGACHDTLLVIIGPKDSDRTLDRRILEAVEHLYVKCPGTKAVVFWAVRWNSQLWSKHAGSFRRVITVLKLFLADPTSLRL